MELIDVVVNKFITPGTNVSEMIKFERHSVRQEEIFLLLFESAKIFIVANRDEVLGNFANIKPRDVWLEVNDEIAKFCKLISKMLGALFELDSIGDTVDDNDAIIAFRKFFHFLEALRFLFGLRFGARRDNFGGSGSDGTAATSTEREKMVIGFGDASSGAETLGGDEALESFVLPFEGALFVLESLVELLESF